MQVTFRCLPELDGVIPRPYPAKSGLPEWLKKMPMTAFSEEWGQDVMTVKQCPPFVDAMSYGFLIPLPCDIHVDKGRFEWDWDEMPISVSSAHTTRSPLGFHVNAQVVETPFYAEDALAIKFMTHWIIELPPGYSLLATHPFNRYDLPFRSLTGFVDSDKYKDNYIHYPALWTDRDFVGVLAKGTPVAQCIPMPRERFEFAFQPLAGEAMGDFLEMRQNIETVKNAYKRMWRSKKA